MRVIVGQVAHRGMRAAGGSGWRSGQLDPTAATPCLAAPAKGRCAAGHGAGLADPIGVTAPVRETTLACELGDPGARDAGRRCGVGDAGLLRVECRRVAAGFEPGRQDRAGGFLVGAAAAAATRSGVLGDPLVGGQALGEEPARRADITSARFAGVDRSWVASPLGCHAGTVPAIENLGQWFRCASAMAAAWRLSGTRRWIWT